MYVCNWNIHQPANPPPPPPLYHDLYDPKLMEPFQTKLVNNYSSSFHSPKVTTDILSVDCFVIERVAKNMEVCRVLMNNSSSCRNSEEDLCQLIINFKEYYFVSS